MSANTKNVTPPAHEEIIPANFEAAYAELDAIVANMASGDMPLDASLSAYKRGNFLLQFCQQALADVEHSVHILNTKNTLDAFSPTND